MLIRNRHGEEARTSAKNAGPEAPASFYAGRVVNPPNRSRFLLPAIAAILVAACDPAAGLSASNSSSTSLLLRFVSAPSSDPDYQPAPFVWKLPAGGAGVAIPRAMGEMQATVEILDEDCRVLASWASRHGGTVTVDPGGTAHFDDVVTAAPGNGPTLEETPRCH